MLTLILIWYFYMCMVGLTYFTLLFIHRNSKAVTDNELIGLALIWPFTIYKLFKKQ